MNRTALLIIAGIAAGAAAGYLIAQHSAVQSLADDVIKSLPPGATDLRLPRPDFAIHLPVTAEDYQLLEQLVCECIAASKQTEAIAVVEDARLCAAKQLRGDFAWPPISGDNDTVQTLWTILGYIASRAIALSVCPAPTPSTPTGPVVQPTMPNPLHRRARRRGTISLRRR